MLPNIFKEEIFIMKLPSELWAFWMALQGGYTTFCAVNGEPVHAGLSTATTLLAAYMTFQAVGRELSEARFNEGATSERPTTKQAFAHNSSEPGV